MAHHEDYLFLCILSDIYTFWNTAAYHCMVVFAASFLGRDARVTVEDTGPLISLPVVFDRCRIREFTAVVCLIPNS